MSSVAPNDSINNKPYVIPPGTEAWTPKPSKPPDLSVPAFIVTLLFNYILGFFAYHFTVSSVHSWQLHDYKKSKRHSKYAVILIVLAIICGLATYAIALSLYFTIRDDTTCPSRPSGNQNLGQDPITTTTMSYGTTTKSTTQSTTECCWHTPFPNGGNEPILRVTDQFDDQNITRSLYCTTTSNGPVTFVSNEKYPDCCVILGCFFGS